MISLPIELINKILLYNIHPIAELYKNEYNKLNSFEKYLYDISKINISDEIKQNFFETFGYIWVDCGNKYEPLSIKLFHTYVLYRIPSLEFK